MIWTFSGREAALSMNRFKQLLNKRRKGSLLAILLFAVMIAIMSFGTLSVASSLYATNEESAKRYAHIQSYRSATEIACYQYINDLQAVTVTKFLTGDWVSVSGSAVYTQACEVIQETVGKEDDPLVWKVSTIEAAIAGATVSNPEIVTNLLGLLAEGRASFMLSVTDYPEIDWTAGESFVSKDESQLKLRPFEVIVELTAKSEVLKEHLFVNGLYLNVLQESIRTEGGTRDTKVTMNISVGESGVQIYRE